MQSLIQRLERKRPPPLGLGPVVPTATMSTTSKAALPTMGGRRVVNIRLTERRAHLHRNKNIKHAIRHPRDERPDGPGEELGERKSLAGVAAERGRLVGGVEVREDGLVEAQVGPARQEAVDGQEEGHGRQHGRHDQQGDEADVEERETRDAHREDAPEEGDGVGGHELAEGDEEGDLEGDRAGDGCEAVYICAQVVVSYPRDRPLGILFGGCFRGFTYVQSSLRVKAKKVTMVAKVSVFGTRAVIKRNFANSREDQARSR